jgi:hypothetical protein
MDFFHSHGQPLDWVFFGDIRGMIYGLAKHSERAADLPGAATAAIRPAIAAHPSDERLVGAAAAPLAADAGGSTIFTENTPRSKQQEM